MAKRSRKERKSSPKVAHDLAPSRRSFIKGGGLVLAGHAIASNQLAVANAAHAFGTDTIKVGLIGCGRRGVAIANEMLSTAGGGVQLVALADIFPSSIQSAYRSLCSRHRDRVDVQNRRYDGLAGFKQVMASDCDVVILATPPAFRPRQFQSAVDAGKHVFMEKPVATDPQGVRLVLETGDLAKQKGLAVAVGLQRRHETGYRECIAQLKDGIIGDPVFARAFWNSSGSSQRPRKAKQSELEYQLRNWQQFTWLGGDLIAEQHIHNLDVINWLMDGHPIQAQGQGSRGADSLTGQVFDQHMVEFVYPGGVGLMSQCRHQKGCWNQVAEQVHMTRGVADISAAKIYNVAGDLIWQSEAGETKGRGWQPQQDDFLAALRRGELPNEVEYGATSTMTAILGRMASYSGKLVKWDSAFGSNVSLADVDSLESLSSLAPVQRLSDGSYAVPVPGKPVT